MVEALDAVLPLVSDDFDRCEHLLLPSLAKNLKCLGRCYIVVPDSQLKRAAHRFRSYNVEVVKEGDISRALARPRLRHDRRYGWYRQQLIKLAAPEVVSTDFYVTLDADVICVRDTTAEDLVHNGRAIFQTDMPPHNPHWNEWAKEVLDWQGTISYYGVTPAVLAVEAVRQLGDYLSSEAVGGRRLWARRMDWQEYLIRRLPWTEYTLYFGFLQMTEALTAYHIQSELQLFGNCVWNNRDYEEWTPAPFVDQLPNYLFSVIQSRTGISVKELRGRLAAVPQLGITA